MFRTSDMQCCSQVWFGLKKTIQQPLLRARMLGVHELASLSKFIDGMEKLATDFEGIGLSGHNIVLLDHVWKASPTLN
jgi:hypothetical protein